MCTFQKHACFEDRVIAEAVRDQLLRTGADYRVEVIVYCFMPDHLHALIEGVSDGSDLLKFLKMFRQRSGYAYRQSGHSRLWQDGYFDKFLRSEEAMKDVVAYIFGNPLKEGLCQDLRTYGLLGSSRYSLAEIVDSLA